MDGGLEDATFLGHVLDAGTLVCMIVSYLSRERPGEGAKPASGGKNRMMSNSGQALTMVEQLQNDAGL